MTRLGLHFVRPALAPMWEDKRAGAEDQLSHPVLPRFPFLANSSPSSGSTASAPVGARVTSYHDHFNVAALTQRPHRCQ